MKKSYADIAGKLMILSAVFSVLTVIISIITSGSDSTIITKITVAASSSIPVFAVTLIFAFGIIKGNKVLLFGWYFVSALGQITKFLEIFFIRNSSTGGFSNPRNFEIIPSYLSDMIFYIAMALFIMTAMQKSKKGVKTDSRNSSVGSVAIIMFIGAAIKLARIIPIAVYSYSYTAKEIVINCICICLVATAFILFGIGIKNRSVNIIWVGVAVEVAARVISQFTSGANVFISITNVISSVLFDVGEAMLMICLLKNEYTSMSKGKKALKADK